MPSSLSKGWDYLEERFGVAEEDMKEYELREVNGDIWLVSAETDTALEAETYGVRFIRQMKIGLKPTTYALQLMEDRLEENVVEVDRDELEKLMAREEMIERDLEEKGYVALKYEGRVIGCGFYKDRKISSRVPKGRGSELSKILDQ